jgi:hypothetical protein
VGEEKLSTIRATAIPDFGVGRVDANQVAPWEAHSPWPRNLFTLGECDRASHNVG